MQTLAAPARFEKEIKKSRFVCQAAPIQSEEEAYAFLGRVKDPSATHNCWAFRVGGRYRFSDDGEPAGTAGRPILAAIEGQGLEGVMVVVTRYFGGIKLGAGGLVRAYGGVAAECLRRAPKRPLVQLRRAWVRVPYSAQAAFHRLLSAHGGKKLEERYGEAAEFLVALPEEALPEFARALADETRGQATLEPVA